MYPTLSLLLNSQENVWRTRSTLRWLLLAFFFVCSCIELTAQEYYYYYKGKKQSLKLNTEFIYVVTSSELGDSQKLRESINADARVTHFDVAKSRQTLKTIAPDASQQYWAEVQLTKKRDARAYDDYIKSVKARSGVQIVSPYFTDRDGQKVGLSQFFYVKLKLAGDYASLEKFARDANVRIAGQNKFMPLWYTLQVTAKSTLNAMEAANRFHESGQFQHAEPALMMDNIKQDVPNDPHYVSQWGLNNTGLYGGTAGIDVNAEDAWNLTKGSRDVIVAVLDQGVEMDHPDLAPNVFGNGFDTGSGSSPSQVLGEHGTACAGIIGAVQGNNIGVSGIAPSAKLMSVSNSLFLTPTIQQELADGINWAWQNGADIISNSWGHNSLASSLIDDAIDDALANGRDGLGTVIVFASGNNNGAVIYPANSNADIITVGAMSECGERKSLVSCDGENTWGSNFGSTLDVVAPGVLVPTTDLQGTNGYNPFLALHNGTHVATDFPEQEYTVWFNGTSSATPMVAGVAALVLSVNKCLTHNQVEDIIEQSAQKVGGYAYAMSPGRPNGTWFNQMGYGLVDAYAAVLLAQGLLASTPAVNLYSQDRPFDTGAEPNPDTGPYYITEDIWVRQNLDGGTTHQNPEYKMFTPNGLYVKIRNLSSKEASPCTNVSLYFSKASTGLVWPTHWHDYFQATSAGNVLHGDLINTVNVPSIPPGGSYTVEVPWFPPNPADFDADIHHFCLLSRITSPSDPMFLETNGVGVWDNVKNNNNIVWKNVSVYNTDISDAVVGLYVRGTLKDVSKVNLRFLDRGFKENVKIRFFERGGTITIGVDPKFVERLKQAKLTDIEVVDEKTLRIKSPAAAIIGLTLQRKETFLLTFKFDVPLEKGEETILDVVQQNAKNVIEGGERFVIRAGVAKEPIVLKSSAIRESVAFPNPASAELYVRYSVGADSNVEISLQNIYSQSQVAPLFKGTKAAGGYNDKFNVRQLPKGIYILTIKIEDRVITERVVID